MYTCKCCYEDIEGDPPRYTLVSLTTKFYQAVYCQACIRYIHENRWRLLKEALAAVDCLAELKRFCVMGMPLRLVHGDLSDPSDSDSEADTNEEIHVIIFKDNSIMFGDLDVDITEKQRDALVCELRELQVRDHDVSQSDIKEIYSHYFR
jgi:hypothetical protein